ncbi:glyoxalase superfamily protein [Paracoccus cavernae]|uniref:Glyoxalase superfamily protein n=1 Tax=Paracoccus cavernae TaxID=1571207 RepID=A0ABT8DDQ4_9RHOB|nr:glyoxalase superfamily protein [Paracoccus cavernae]
MNFTETAPIMRIFDIGKARDFYCGFLGMSWDWEHRFHPDAPLYAQISRAGLVLHLSEHHGDRRPARRFSCA